MVEKIPLTDNCVFTQSHAQKFAHLRDLDILSESDPQIDILIGTDNPYPFWCLQSRTGHPSEPYAQLSPLGWFVVGFGKDAKKDSSSNKANVMLTNVSSSMPPVNLNISTK